MRRLDDDVCREFLARVVDDGLVEGQIQETLIRIGFGDFNERAGLATTCLGFNLEFLAAFHLLNKLDDAALLFGQLQFHIIIPPQVFVYLMGLLYHIYIYFTTI